MKKLRNAKLLRLLTGVAAFGALAFGAVACDTEEPVVEEDPAVQEDGGTTDETGDTGGGETEDEA